MSPGLIIYVWDLTFFTQYNIHVEFSQCTSGTCVTFLIGTRQHFILQGLLNKDAGSFLKKHLTKLQCLANVLI